LSSFYESPDSPDSFFLLLCFIMGQSLNIKFVLWDVDGVFVDTEKLHFEAWNKMLSQFGKNLGLAEYIPLVGRDGKENAETIHVLKGISCDKEQFRADRRTIYKRLREKDIPLIKENIELVKSFVSEFPRIRHAVVSSEQKIQIGENLRAAEIDNLFELIVSYENHPDLKRKPAPDMYLYALKKLGANPEECLVFEDSASGVAAATSAKIKCVALPNEFTKNHNFSAAAFIIFPGEKRAPAQILKKLGF